VLKEDPKSTFRRRSASLESIANSDEVNKTPVGESSGSDVSVEPTDVESPPSKTAGPPTEGASVVDTTPTTSAATDGAGSTTGDDGPSAVKKDSGSRASEPVDERSRLAANAAPTYDGRTTQQPADVSRGGPAGAPEPTRDTRPLISDDDDVEGGGEESALRIVGEVWLPFLLAGFGSVLAGLVLDLVQVRICISLCVPVVIMLLVIYDKVYSS